MLALAPTPPSPLTPYLTHSPPIHGEQEKGFTEPDPRDDLGGVDVARKVVIIARECGMNVELGDVPIKSLVRERQRQRDREREREREGGRESSVTFQSSRWYERETETDRQTDRQTDRAREGEGELGDVPIKSLVRCARG